MIKRLIRSALLVALAVLPIGHAWAAAETASARPNVLLIVADDLGARSGRPILTGSLRRACGLPSFITMQSAPCRGRRC